ncbi:MULTISPECIES: hypothetical protein [unclassified Marinovum]
MSIVPTLTRAGLAALMLAGSTLALAAGELRSHIDLHIVDIDESGAEELVERSTVKPGELIHFTIKHENLTDDEVNELVIVGPIPDGVSLKMGTEQSSLDATFEVQAEMDPELPGLEWSTLPAMRKIIEEDGTVRLEPVPEEIVEAVRWTLDASLPAGENALNSYRVVVN